MPPRIEEDKLGFNVTVYPNNGTVHALVTDPATGRPINMMVLPPDDADSFADELKMAATLARRQDNPHEKPPSEPAYPAGVRP